MGTKAINIAKQDHLVVTGSFLNLKALTSFLVEMDKGLLFYVLVGKMTTV